MQYRVAEIGHWYEPDKIMGYCVAFLLAKLIVVGYLSWNGDRLICMMLADYHVQIWSLAFTSASRGSRTSLGSSSDEPAGTSGFDLHSRVLHIPVLSVSMNGHRAGTIESWGPPALIALVALDDAS